MEDKKILVVFFSHTGENFFPGGIRRIEKGNTHIAAEMIAEICKADLFEIKTVQTYSDIYKECVEQAKTEFQENARPELKEDMDIHAYDVVFVGYQTALPSSLLILSRRAAASSKFSELIALLSSAFALFIAWRLSNLSLRANGILIRSLPSSSLGEGKRISAKAA